MTTMAGYLRVSTSEQASSGLGIAAQREAIAREADRRGWNVEWFVDDGYSASTMNRPAVTEAFDLLRRKGAAGLIVAKLDRLSRSLVDFSTVMADARKAGWAVIALDLGVDTTTPAGELVANVMAAVAQWERRAIQARTTDALAAAKARGQRLGRPRTTPDAVVARIRDMSVLLGPSAIARELTADGTPTVRQAGPWRPSSVRRILAGIQLDEQADAARRHFGGTDV